MIELTNVEKQMLDSERLGLPSASSLDRLANCPGSRAAEVGLPELPKADVTDSGTAIHSALETGDDAPLEFSEKEIAARLRAMEVDTVARWMEENGITTTPLRIAERRFWMLDRKSGERIASARLDTAYVMGEFGLALDFKSGFKRPTPSELNWQVRCQCVVLWHEYPALETIRAGIAASRLSSHLDTTDHTREDLKRIEYEIRHVIWRANQPDAPRVPGAHCRYCRAMGQCREYAVYVSIATAHVPVPAKGKLDAWAMIEAVRRMTPAEMAFVYRRKSAVTTIYDAIKARMLSLPDEALAEVGYRRAPGVTTKEIENVALAFSRLSPLLTNEERAASINLVRGTAANLLAERTGDPLKACKEAVDAAMGDALVAEPGEERLKEL